LRRLKIDTKKSEALYERARRVMVGGVNSPVRAFKSVGGSPLFIARGKGQRIWDVDGNCFVDLVLSWGPMIVGHAHPKVVRALTVGIKSGTSFGAPTEPELKLAEEVCSSVPSMEVVRFVNSGTEATMSALRLARAYTKRSKVLKFDGCYHGHADPFLSRGGSGLATFDIPVSAGVTEDQVSNTLTVPYNDVDAVRDAVRRQGRSLAAVIVEPVAGNMGVIPPEPGFLSALRRICTENGSVLIFDEVITGFRLSKGGAQSVFSVKPDITCLSKILGGGFPVGAYGGRREIMELVSPDGPVYQAGTLSGNPVAMTAGLVTLSLLNRKAYSKLENLSSTLEKGLLDAAEDADLPLTVNRVGSMVGLFFGKAPIRNFDEVKGTKHMLYPRFHRSMLESGIYLPPSPFETIFLSTAHTNADIQNIVGAAQNAFKKCAR
jgi:glutamate-1-semialdehyde 2,1-aminomutase